MNLKILEQAQEKHNKQLRNIALLSPQNHTLSKATGPKRPKSMQQTITHHITELEY